MKIPPLTSMQVEKIRLILSTYQDGTGQQIAKTGQTLPGWRDFERAVALSLGGIGQENKAIFDVLIPHPHTSSFIGVSCKMRRELKYPKPNLEVPLELSNSSGKFWDVLMQEHELTTQTYKQYPEKVAHVLFSIVNGWHQKASKQMGVEIDLDASFYLALLWNEKGYYQLFQFPLALPNLENLYCHFPPDRLGRPGRHLRGKDDAGKLFEWYGESGGQLKYYPRPAQATWKSDPFQLEPLPANTPDGILSKVQTFFPAQWASTESRISSL
jgi:hypothetical protein